jgi:predicted Zn-dependent protease
MGECLIQLGRPDDALVYLHRAATYSTQMQALYARGLALAGRAGEARALVDSLERTGQNHYVSRAALAGAYAALGDTASAFASLHRAVDDRAAEMALIPLRVMVESLGSDPRFADVLRRMRPM